MSIILSIAVAGASVPGATATGPLAMAEQGKLQCYRPDALKKTCQSIASYLRTGPGIYDNKAVIQVSAEASLETHTSVTIKGDAVCGSIRTQDITAGVLRAGGRALDPETARPILERIAQSMMALADKEICTRYERSGDDFTAKVAIGGVYRPDQDVKVLWITSGDGYTVAP